MIYFGCALVAFWIAGFSGGTPSTRAWENLRVVTMVTSCVAGSEGAGKAGAVFKGVEMFICFSSLCARIVDTARRDPPAAGRSAIAQIFLDQARQPAARRPFRIE